MFNSILGIFADRKSKKNEERVNLIICDFKNSQIKCLNILLGKYSNPVNYSLIICPKNESLQLGKNQVSRVDSNPGLLLHCPVDLQCY